MYSIIYCTIYIASMKTDWKSLQFISKLCLVIFSMPWKFPSFYRHLVIIYNTNNAHCYNDGRPYNKSKAYYGPFLIKKYLSIPMCVTQNINKTYFMQSNLAFNLFRIYLPMGEMLEIKIVINRWLNR